MRDSLVKILCEPKNALVKQYKQLFDLDGVKRNSLTERSGPLRKRR